MGAILSGEDDVEAPEHAMADDYTLQNMVDTLLKGSAGRFDYAITIMETFAKDMRLSNGQFLSSVKKAQVPLRQKYATEFDNRSADFGSPFRSYRDKEGRSGKLGDSPVLRKICCKLMQAQVHCFTFLLAWSHGTTTDMIYNKFQLVIRLIQRL